MTPSPTQATFESMELTISRGHGRKRLVVVGKFTNDRVSECEGFPFRYDLRGSDMDCGSPGVIQEPGAVVNYCGKFFAEQPVPLGTDGWSPIHDWWLI